MSEYGTCCGRNEDLQDKELLNLFLAGNDSVYSTIYNKYVDVLFAYGIGLGVEQELLKDAIQDVFYKLYFNRNVLKNVANLKYYLFRMLKNRLIDLRKSSVDTCEITGCDFSFSIKATILDELIQEEDCLIIQQRVESLLSCLTARQREAIYLRFIQELEYEEIACLLNMSSQGVRKLVCRAMERMREQDVLFYFLLFYTTQFYS